MVPAFSFHQSLNLLDFYSSNMNLRNLLQKLSRPIPRYWGMFEKRMAGTAQGRAGLLKRNEDENG